MVLFIEIASWVLLVGGAGFCIVGAVGLLRMPDLYSRTHAATITDTLGAGMVLVGLALQAGPNLTALKLLMVLAFLLYTSPVSGHALVKAAYSHGIKAELDVPIDPQQVQIPERPARDAPTDSARGKEGADDVSD